MNVNMKLQLYGSKIPAKHNDKPEKEQAEEQKQPERGAAPEIIPAEKEEKMVAGLDCLAEMNKLTVNQPKRDDKDGGFNIQEMKDRYNELENDYYKLTANGVTPENIDEAKALIYSIMDVAKQLFEHVEDPKEKEAWLGNAYYWQGVLDKISPSDDYKTYNFEPNNVNKVPRLRENTAKPSRGEEVQETKSTDKAGRATDIQEVYDKYITNKNKLLNITGIGTLALASIGYPQAYKYYNNAIDALDTLRGIGSDLIADYDAEFQLLRDKIIELGVYVG